MPSQQRRRGDEEDLPRRAGKHDPIPRLEIGTVHLTAQYGQLMTKHHDLGRFGPVTAAQQEQELKDTPEDEVKEGPRHRQQDARDLIMLEP
ncbi:hypothetical protein AB0G05_04440 [Nonomuraea wenchangensis]